MVAASRPLPVVAATSRLEASRPLPVAVASRLPLVVAATSLLEASRPRPAVAVSPRVAPLLQVATSSPPRRPLPERSRALPVLPEDISSRLPPPLVVTPVRLLVPALKALAQTATSTQARRDRAVSLAPPPAPPPSPRQDTPRPPLSLALVPALDLPASFRLLPPLRRLVSVAPPPDPLVTRRVPLRASLRAAPPASPLSLATPPELLLVLASLALPLASRRARGLVSRQASPPAPRPLPDSRDTADK